MVMMGSQTFFLYFQKKTCKILVSFRIFIYLCSALSVEIQEEQTSAPWQQDAPSMINAEFTSQNPL
mgnify:FL=1